jgi:NAD(P)H-dependent FMN reductase
MLKIQIILGSTRPNRMSETVGRWIASQAQKKTETEVEILDLRDFPMPFFNEPVPPAMLKGKYSDKVVAKWVKKVAEGDAYIIIAPEYNHGYPAVLKNALDYPYSEWNNKPVGFVSYGGVAGARSIEQLRQVVIELQMTPIRNSVNIAGVFQAFDEKGQPKDSKLNDFAGAFLDQLVWWAKTLKKAQSV